MTLSELTAFCIVHRETGLLFKGLRGNHLFPSKGAAKNAFNQKRKRYRRFDHSFEKPEEWVVREITCSPASE